MPLTLTAIYAALLGIMAVVLSIQVSRMRGVAKQSLGDGGHEGLTRAIRVHGNFVENVPLGLILLALSELQGAPAIAIHGLGLMLLIGRVLHAVGLSRPRTANPMRGAGSLATLLMISFASIGLLGHAIP